MKKLLAILVLTVGSFTIVNAQNVEVLFFKGELSCCAAKACKAMETDLKELIEAKYTNGSVIFRTIKLTDESNAELVKRFNAKNQTVVAVRQSKHEDLTSIVAAYSRNKNKNQLEKDVTEKINKILK